MKDRFFERFEFFIFIIPIILSIAGLLFVQSAFGGSRGIAPEFLKQALYIGFGIVLMLAFAFFDYENLENLVVPLSVISIALLIVVLVAGHSAKGAQRWISLGSIGTFQPSEPAKIVLILALAKIFSNPGKLTKRDIVPIAITLFIPWLLIFLQPDLGTSVVFVFITFMMLFVKGANIWLLLGGLLSGAGILSVFLKDYQKERLFVFMNSNADISGAAWNITQSKIAIGNGAIFGNGIFAGTQSQLDFVPEHGTDFIFSLVAEECGFIGIVIMLLLYAFLLWRVVNVIKSAKDWFGFYTAIGIFSLILFHVFVNIGMVSGIMPVVGVPLTFISYGGSAILSNFIAIGILESIYSRRERLF